MNFSQLSLLVLLAITSAALDVAIASDRVNPHGATTDILNIELFKSEPSKAKACLGCHAFEKSRLSLGPAAKAICSNCHNSSPHSGVIDHANHGVTCLNCHSFHRKLAITSKNFAFPFQSKGKTPDGLIEKTNHNALLKKNCMDCHKW